MAYTEKTTISYGSRLSNSFSGIGMGFILLIVATVLLWRNEGSAVRTAHDIKEVGKNATHVESIESTAPDGSFIHANGIAQTTDTIADPFFKVAANALCIEREVEYYQWVEYSQTRTEDKMGGSEERVTTYTYKCEWVKKPVDSNNFHDPQYRNKNNALPSLNIKNNKEYASVITFGAYRIPNNFIQSVAHCAMKESPMLNIDPEILKALNQSVAEAQSVGARVKNNISKTLVNNNDSTSFEWVHVSGNEIYLGQSAGAPNAGDMRINFTIYKPSAEISLIAVVKGNSFTEYKTKNKKKTYYVTSGTESLEDMMESAEKSNEIWTWVLRILGIMLVCLAFRKLFGFFVTLLKVVPIVATILGWGVGLICNILGVVYSLIIIAAAWIFYRPLLGVCLLALAAGVAGGFIYWSATRKKNVGEQPKEQPEEQSIEQS